MKIKFQYIVLAACSLAIGSCKKDNYSAPSSMLSGRLVYKGEPIGVDYKAVPFELYQYGFGTVGAISSTISSDGSYSALLFNGTYKLDIPNGQGPFMWPQTVPGVPDSLTIVMKGNQTLDLNVIPYYIIGSPVLTVVGDTAVSATFKAEQIITDPALARGIDAVDLYINKTAIVGSDNSQQIKNKDSVWDPATSDPNNIVLSVNIPKSSLTGQNYVFARVGIKISGLEDRILSQIIKLTF